MCCGAYKIDSIQLDNVGVEAQTLGDPPQLFCDVLSSACLGAIDDQGATGGRGHGMQSCG